MKKKIIWYYLQFTCTFNYYGFGLRSIISLRCEESVWIDDHVDM